jgi:hypothetical protein
MSSPLPCPSHLALSSLAELALAYVELWESMIMQALQESKGTYMIFLIGLVNADFQAFATPAVLASGLHQCTRAKR